VRLARDRGGIKKGRADDDKVARSWRSVGAVVVWLSPVESLTTGRHYRHGKIV